MAHLRNDLLASQLDVARRRAALIEDADPLVSFRPPEGVSASLLDLQRQLLLDQLIEQKSKLTALDRQRLQKEAERTTIAATIEKLQTTIPFIEQRVDIRKGLADKELGSKIVYLETIQQLNETRFELAVQKKRYEEASAAWRRWRATAPRPLPNIAGRGPLNWPRPTASRSACAMI